MATVHKKSSLQKYVNYEQMKLNVTKNLENVDTNDNADCIDTKIEITVKFVKEKSL